MRVFKPHSWACERARQAASLRLDGELSQLESAFLERHLRRCDPCSHFAVDVGRLTDALRDAPLVALQRPIELPLRKRVSFGARRAGAWVAAGAAAAAALLAVVILPAQRVHVPVTGPSPTPRAVTTNNEDLRDLRILRMAQMKPTALILARTSPRGPEL
jgi:predicted anti-sigma-YlaC factor YlaD